MALCEFDFRRTEFLTKKYIDQHRPPEDIRDKIDIGFRIENQNVEIFKIRPSWNDPKKKIKEPVAKATFVKSTRIWKIYWQRADLKWHRYEPIPEVDDIVDFLQIVDEDEHNCFWG